ncbi:MAG: single-stranded-DNA-specific exonuclease RecJ [Firmicutes bacterium]|nr:single-stranded-DNA-specific exonuclease RecJ [Bacillota bacterium]
MNINPIIIDLLHMRGIDTAEEMVEFLTDKPKKTYDPFLLPNMEAGVDLILSEIKKNSKICIYGDYDADGITSTTLMLSVLSRLTSKDNLDYYIPSRFEEGYGLNRDAVKTIADRGFNLLVTVDCGSVSYEEVEYAKSLGMNVVVTDHHNITDVMADCPLINPKHPESIYPFKELSGCGVAFKVAQALQQKSDLPKAVLTEVLDLVAIGTIGDIMPLVDENRTMTKFGMKVLNLGGRDGLRRLIEGTSLKVGEITSENISFVIVPHLNASGRIEDASQAVELLYGNCSNERKNHIVEDILKKNQQRRNLQAQTFKDCAANIDKDNLSNLILINSGEAHEGIAGIVAGKIKETFYRPTIIVTPSGEDDCFLKGTGRSVEGLNLYELLKTQEHLFEKFGGHAGACGFLLKKDNFEALKEGLELQMENICRDNPEVFHRKYHVDLELEVEDLTIELAEQLKLLAPFGNKNPKPVIMCDCVYISDVKYMGSDSQHVRFSINSFDNGAKVQGVMFNKAQNVDFEQASFEAGVIGTLDVQVWQGVKRLQFQTEEIQFDEKVGR